MKVCQTCNVITDDSQHYCAYDGQLLVEDQLATALQNSVTKKYTLVQLIGTGSMGAVYRAQHHALGDVAIKVMLGPPDNHKLSERFLREAKALRKLNNPHAVLVFDLERSPTGLTYMVMEMVEGRSLRQELRERGRLSLKESLDVAEAVCDALEDAHKHGIIHRDLKPDNILLAEERDAGGEVSRLVKIVDFGIVKLRGTREGSEEVSMQLTKYGAPIGTPFYMSPEQWFGDGPGFTALDGRTDIYALGCTLYEMLSGYPPFMGQTKEEMRTKHLGEPPQPLTEITSDVPEAFSRLILLALEKDRDFRPASAAEFAAGLRRAYDEALGAKSGAESADEVRKLLRSLRRDGAEPTPYQMTHLQKTEESFTVIREWVDEGAQEVIEQVRDREPFNPQTEGGPVTEGDGSLALQQTPQVSAEEADLEHTASRTLKDPGGLAPASDARPRAPGGVEAEPGGEIREVMVATSGPWSFGLFVEEAEDVSHWRQPVPLPHSPPAVLGVVSVRGRMLIVLDPAALLGEDAGNGAGPAPGFIIALRGDEHLALAVDRVVRTIGIQPSEIRTSVDGAGSTISRGVIHRENVEIMVLDTRELFAAATQGAERRRQRTL